MNKLKAKLKAKKKLLEVPDVKHVEEPLIKDSESLTIYHKMIKSLS